MKSLMYVLVKNLPFMVRRLGKALRAFELPNIMVRLAFWIDYFSGSVKDMYFRGRKKWR